MITYSLIALLASTLLATTCAYTLSDFHYNIKLYVEYLPQNVGKDGYEPVDGKFLQAVKIDPETYLIVLGDADEAVTFHFEYIPSYMYIVEDNIPYYLTTDTSFNLIATSKYSSRVGVFAANSAQTVFEYIKVVTPITPGEDIYSFIPKKDIGDAIGYSKDHYALVCNKGSNDKGALIHYEVMGADTGDGEGISNPSSFTATQPVSTSITLSAIDFGTDVYTTDPPTVPISTGTISQSLDHGIYADYYGLRLPESENSVSTKDSPDSGTGTGTGSKSSLASKTSSGTSNESSGSAQAGTASGKTTDSGSPSSSSPGSASSSSSNTSINPKTLLKNRANGRSLTSGAAGILAIFAAVM